MNNRLSDNSRESSLPIGDVELELDDVNPIDENDLDFGSKKISDSIENIKLDEEPITAISNNSNNKSIQDSNLDEVDIEMEIDDDSIDEDGIDEDDTIGKAYSRLQGNVELGSNMGSFSITTVDDNEELSIDPEEDEDEEENDTYDMEIEVDSEPYDETVDLEQLGNITSSEATPNNSEESEEVMQKSKERLINKLQKIRNNVPVEESRVELQSIMSETIRQVKAYCDNLYDCLDSNEPKRKTKNSNDRYFGLLTTSFQKKYLANVGNAEERISPEEFMIEDIRSELLDLGDRLPSDVREKVIASAEFTPSDLLGNEWQIIRLISRLKDEMKNMNCIITNENATKNILSGIRTQIVRKYTPDTFKRKERGKELNYCYVDKLSINGTNETFICGHCHEKSKTELPFYSLGILPFQGQDKNKGNVYQAIDIPASNICEHCGCRNILTVEEVRRLSNATIKMQKALMDGYAKASSASCSSFAMTRYHGSKDLILATLPNLEEQDEEEFIDDLDEVATDKDLESNKVSNDNIDDAHKRYRDMIAYFKDNVDYGAKPTIHTIPEVVGLDDIANKKFINNVDLEENNKVYQTPVFKSNLTNLAKIIAGVTGSKYKDLKYNAVNSIIMHIKDSKLYKDLCYTNTEGQVIATKSKDIKDYLEQLESEEQVKVISTLCGMIDYKYEDIVDIQINKVKINELPKFKDAIAKYFDKLQDLADKSVAKRNQLLNDLKSNIRLYAFVPLANIPVITGAEELLYDHDFIEFLNETADMMVIMNLSEKFLKYWKTILGKSNSNSFKQLADINSLNNFTYAEKILTKTKIMQFEPRFPKVQKEDLLLQMFTLLQGIDLEQLAKLDGVRQAYESDDIFTLMNKIESINVMESTCATANGERYTYDTAIFKPVREMITDLLPVAREFIEKYGRSDSDRLKYYLGSIFTEEEINSVDARRYKNMKLNVLIDKNEGESVTAYLKRLNAVLNKTDVKDLKYFKSDYQEKVDKWEVVIIGANLPLMFFENTVKQIKEVMTAIDLLYQIMQRDINKMIEIMRVPKSLANKLIAQEGYIQQGFNKRELDAKNYLIKSIYLIDAFNFTGNLADLDIANDNADATLSMGDSDEDRIKAIISDASEFEKATKHLPREVVKLINEFYTIR